MDPAVMHAENGGASHKELEEEQEEQDGSAVLPYDLFHQASLLTTRKHKDEVAFCLCFSSCVHVSTLACCVFLSL